MPVTRDAYALFVGGEWQEALPGGTFEVANPATGEVCAVLPDGGRAEMRRAIAAAHGAQPGWGRTTAGCAFRGAPRALSPQVRRSSDDGEGSVGDPEATRPRRQRSP